MSTEALRTVKDRFPSTSTGSNESTNVSTPRGVDAVRGLGLPRRLSDVMADVANYTDITPVMQFSEIVS